MRFPTIPIEIGTRVVCVDNFVVPKGLSGTAVDTEPKEGIHDQLLCVNWDEDIPGCHSCGGKAEPGHGWNVRLSAVKIIGYDEWKGVE